MKSPLWDKLWYKIVPIGLDLLNDQLYDFITLQLPSFLNANSDKCIAFEIMTLMKKNLLNQIEN